MDRVRSLAPVLQSPCIAPHSLHCETKQSTTGALVALTAAVVVVVAAAVINDAVEVVVTEMLGNAIRILCGSAVDSTISLCCYHTTDTAFSAGCWICILAGRPFTERTIDGASMEIADPLLTTLGMGHRRLSPDDDVTNARTRSGVATLAALPNYPKVKPGSHYYMVADCGCVWLSAGHG